MNSQSWVMASIHCEGWQHQNPSDMKCYKQITSGGMINWNRVLEISGVFHGIGYWKYRVFSMESGIGNIGMFSMESEAEEVDLLSDLVNDSL